MTNKPKLSVHTAINKRLIAWGIKNDKKLRVYYKWDLAKRSNPIRIPSIIVDYDGIKREWYVNYLNDDDTINSCTIDDITGTSTIKLFDLID